jgi:hypothetical protein
MLCSDPLVRAFKGYGYNVIRLPSAQFTPLLLLESDGRRAVHAIGPIDRNLPALSVRGTPSVHRDDLAPNLDIKTTGHVRGQIAASVLGPVLAAMGAGDDVSVALARARSVVMALRDVRRDWVELGEVAEYLESGTEHGSVHVREAARRGELFLVTAILKSREFSVDVDRSVAEQFGALAPSIGPVTVSINEKAERSDSSVVSFTGTTPLAFAFQAVKLLYEDGQYVDFATAKGLSGFAQATSMRGIVEGLLALNDDLVELDVDF